MRTVVKLSRKKSSKETKWRFMGAMWTSERRKGGDNEGN